MSTTTKKPGEPDLAEVERQRNRADEIADKMRAYLVAVNSGGIALISGLVGVLTSNEVDPSWAKWPVTCFIAGLIVTGGSLQFAKHKATKRRDAAWAGEPTPDYKAHQWRNSTWDGLSLVLFVLGVVSGLWNLPAI